MQDTNDPSRIPQPNTPPRWLTSGILLAILLIGGYFRILGLHTWDDGTLQHPNERLVTAVATEIRLPSDMATYFDAARSPANPQHITYDNRVLGYGTLPVLLTRMVAVMLTPPDVLPAMVDNPAAHSATPGRAPPPAQIVNPETQFPRLPGGIQRMLNPNGVDLTSYTQIYRIGRTLAMLFDLASLLLIYALGKRVVGWRAGVLAAGLAAALVLHIQQAHFFLTPAFATFFCLLALWGMVRVAQGGRIGAYLLMGMAIGIAAAVNITLAALALLAIAAMLMGMVMWRHNTTTHKPFWQTLLLRGIPMLLLAGILALLTFRVAQPYAFTGSTPTSPPIAGNMGQKEWLNGVNAWLDGLAGMGFWDMRLNPRYIQDMTTIAKLQSGEQDSPAMLHWVNRTDYLYPLTNLILWGMGPLAGIAAWGGWLVFAVWVGIRWRRETLTITPPLMGLALLWLWVAIYFAWQGGQFAVPLSSLLPITGPLLILGAWLLDHMVYSKSISYHHNHSANIAQLSPAPPAPAPIQGEGEPIPLLPLAGEAAGDGGKGQIPDRNAERQRRREAENRTTADGEDVRETNLRSRLSPRLVKRLALVLMVLVVGGTLVWAYAFTRIYTRPHTRTAATQWILQHGRSGVHVAYEGGSAALPLTSQESYAWLKAQELELPTYAQDTPSKYTGDEALPGMLDMLDQADYLTLTSSEGYRSIERLPTRYPITKRFYQQLFAGNLGFELVADITSYPRLGGITIPDQSAEMSFHAYDHPRVLIFRKSGYNRWYAEELLTQDTQDTNWNEITPLPVGRADQAPTGLKLTTNDYPRYHEGGTWHTLFDPQRINPALAPLAWLLVLEALGLAMFAVLFVLLPWLPDRGWSLAKILGLLFVALGAWLKGSLDIAAFTPRSVWVCAGVLMLTGVIMGTAAYRQLVAYWRNHRSLLLTGETVFLVVFAGFVLLRWYNPDLWHPWRGGEKPMEFAYLNAILQSSSFPPYDPWYAGGYINYYYFGFVIVGAMIHLTGIIPAIAFNLAVPTIAALTALAAWGAVYNLLAPTPPAPSPPAPTPPAPSPPAPSPIQGEGELSGSPSPHGGGRGRGWGLYGKEMGGYTSPSPPAPAPIQGEGEPPPISPSPHGGGRGRGWGLPTRASPSHRKRAWRAHISAILAPFLLLLTGNLVQAFWYLNGYAAEQTHRPEWAFWDATRIVPGTVNEFPFFTFLFADMHPHMLVMPFSLALVGVMVAMVRLLDWHRRMPSRTTLFILPLVWYLPLLGMAAVLAGTLHVTNTWDYPTYLGLTLATLVLIHYALWRRFHNHTSSPQRLLGQVLLSLAFAAVVVIWGGYLLFLPFHTHFASESSGVMLLRDGAQSGLWQQVWHAERTTLRDMLLLYGFWLFVMVSSGALLLHRWLRLPRWITAGCTLLVLTIAAMGAYREQSSPALLIPLLVLTIPLLWQLRHLPPRLMLPILWATTALAILLGIEVVVVRGDVGRMNTVFKFGLHAWTLFALTAAVAIPWLWQTLPTRTGRMPGGMLVHWIWRGALLALIGAALVYPITATPARLTDRYSEDVPHTLDGMAFFGYVDGNEEGYAFPLSEDAAAIEWIQQHITGTPIILEAHQPSYRWGARIATYTGLPTLLGWEWHQRQQRSLVDIHPVFAWEQPTRPAGIDRRTVIDHRREAIATMYNTPDPMLALGLIERYGIEYVYVGGVEHALYEPLGLAKFDTLVAQGELKPVFQQGATTLYQVISPGSPTVIVDDSRIETPAVGKKTDEDQRKLIPQLMLKEPVNMLPAMRGFAWNTWANGHTWGAVLIWLVALYSLTLLGIPIAFVIFRRWNDGGVFWARIISLVVVGYAVWLPTSLAMTYNSISTLVGAIVAVIVLDVVLLALMGGMGGGYPGKTHHGNTLSPYPLSHTRAGGSQNSPSPHSGGRGRGWGLTVKGGSPRFSLRRGLRLLGRHLRQHRRSIFTTEILFLVAFAAFTLIRAYNPDMWHPIWGGEKPMETGFLNANLRSPVMPPYSPFYSDGYINYYYYGFFLLSLLLKATGIAPSIGYNLIIPTIFALILAGSYSIVRQLTGKMWAGIIGAVFVTIIGNLASVVKIGWSQGIEPVLAALRTPEAMPFLERVQGLGKRIGDWYIGPSRIFVDPVFTINEFPYWSFLYADLHPHIIVIPISLLSIALAYQLLRWAASVGRKAASSQRDWLEAPILLAITALVLGTLAVTNSWDFPTYGLLCGAALFGGAWRNRNYRWQRWIGWLVGASLLAIALVLGGMAYYMPFFEHYYAMVSGVGRVKDAMPIKTYLVLHGIFVAIIVPVLFGALWRVVAWRKPSHSAAYLRHICPPPPDTTPPPSPSPSPAPYGGQYSPVGRGLLSLPFVAALVGVVMAAVRGAKQQQTTRALPKTPSIVAGLALIGLLPIGITIIRKLFVGKKLPVQQAPDDHSRYIPLSHKGRGGADASDPLLPLAGRGARDGGYAKEQEAMVQRDTEARSTMESVQEIPDLKSTYTPSRVQQPAPSLTQHLLAWGSRVALLVLVVLLVIISKQQPDIALRLWMGGLLMVSALLLLTRHIKHTTWFIILIAALAWSVTFGYELFFIRDHVQDSDYYRMNTVFKFGMQVWVLLALAAAASLPLLSLGLRRLGQVIVRWVQQAGRGRHTPVPRGGKAQRVGGWITLAVGTFPITTLVLIGLIFPLVGTPSRIDNRIPGSQELTLDGLAFFEYGEFTHNGKTVYLQPDGEAIAWLNEHIVGTPIVLQSGLSFYREYGVRIAANTGLPTVVSSLHENEQRDPEDVGIRDRDMDTIYRSTDSGLTFHLLQKYRVNYVYVGSVERAFYPSEGLAKFGTILDPFLDLVYENPGVQIYRVRNIPQPYPMPPSIQDKQKEITFDPADLPGPIPEDDETLEQEDTKTLELYHKLSPTHASVARILAARYEKLNRFDDAVNILETYIKRKPDDVLMLHVLGDVLARDGRLDAAEDMYREAANISMKSADWDKLGRELLSWGRLDKAELALIRAITIEPVDTPAYYHLAETYIQQDNTRQAIKYLDMYLQAAPDGYFVDSAQTLLDELREQ